MANVRIAKVKATGERFVVQQLAFGRKPGDPSFAHTWGHLASFSARRDTRLVTSSKYVGAKKFALDEVEIANDVPFTLALANELLAQAERASAAGALGDEAQRAANEKLSREMGKAFLDEVAATPALASALAKLARGR